jgi:hypothetical protein
MGCVMGSEGEARTKGVGFVNVKSFATERFGANAWDAVLERLAPEDREELSSIVSVGWYSLPLYARLIHALDDVHGYGDLSLVVQLGRYEAERDLTTIHRIFLRFTNPAFIVEKTGEFWKRFHDTGEWKVEREPNGVAGTLEGWGCVDHALCRELVGYLSRVLELVGAKNVVFEHPRCRARGDGQCFFRARWGSLPTESHSTRDVSGAAGGSGVRPSADSSASFSSRERS